MKLLKIFPAISSFFLAGTALATEHEGDNPRDGGSGPINIINPLKSDDFLGLINSIIDTLILIAGPIAVIMIIYAGFLYTTSAGRPDQVKKAHKTILYTVIGLVVLLLSKGIFSLVISIVNG